MKLIRLYVEGEGGGGDEHAITSNNERFRRCWSKFLEPIIDYARDKDVRLQLVHGHSRNRTIKSASAPYPLDLTSKAVLLIDSDCSVVDHDKPWEAIGEAPSTGLGDEDCFLMVQCLECWLVADLDGVENHFNRHGECFDRLRFSDVGDCEAVTCRTMEVKFKAATRKCIPPYSHAGANFIISDVDRSRLQCLASVQRLFDGLESVIDAIAD